MSNEKNKTNEKLNVVSRTSNTYTTDYNSATKEVTLTFPYTGEEQTWTVPDGVTKIHVDAYGASGCTVSPQEGGNGKIGKGGRVQTKLSVTSGQVLNIYVGGTRHYTTQAHATGGWNGGGNAPSGTYSGVSFTGGGATDIRIGGTDLSNRVIVAGGGGGEANREQWRGGDGGGLTGQNGTGEARGDAMEEVHRHGSGGSQIEGGIGGNKWNGHPSSTRVCSTIIRWNTMSW